jgi:hypothetical protein
MLCEKPVGATIRHFADSWTSSAGAAGNFISPISGLSANAFKTVIDIDTIGSVSRPAFFIRPMLIAVSYSSIPSKRHFHNSSSPQQRTLIQEQIPRLEAA